MRTNRRTPAPTPSPRFYWGADVPMRVIRRFARQVADRFQPDKIILFGSHAYGTPHADSDVDILVIMPTRNQHDQAARIRWEVPALFPMDLIVRTPKNLAWRLAEGESFHTEVVAKGKVLYEKNHSRLGAQSRKRLRPRRANRPHHRSLSGLRRGFGFLTDFAVDGRSPGHNATKREAERALRWATKARDTCRLLLGLGSLRSRRRRSP